MGFCSFLRCAILVILVIPFIVAMHFVQVDADLNTGNVFAAGRDFPSPPPPPPENISPIQAISPEATMVCLRNIRNLSMPGSKLPDWFSQESVVHFSERKNRTIKAVIVCVVVSLDREIPEDMRYSRYVPDIKAIMLDQNIHILSTSLNLRGIPKIHEDQIHICRYSNINPLVSFLKDGCKIQVRKLNPPVIEGVEVKKSGIHLIFEDDDDYDGNEELLDESEQSVSKKLADFFNSYEEDNQV